MVRPVRPGDKDSELIEKLKEIDNTDLDVTEWEADFLETVLKWDGELTPKQRASAEKMVEKYEDQI